MGMTEREGGKQGREHDGTREQPPHLRFAPSLDSVAWCRFLV